MSLLTSDLKIISRCSFHFKNELLRPYCLTARQTELMLAVRRHPHISQDGIAADVFINKSTVARQLGDLEEKGYIRRELSSGDRRVTLVDLTEKGAEMIPVILDINRQWSDYITQSMTQEEVTALTDRLDELKTRALAYMKERKET